MDHVIGSCRANLVQMVTNAHFNICPKTRKLPNKQETEHKPHREMGGVNPEVVAEATALLPEEEVHHSVTTQIPRVPRITIKRQQLHTRVWL